MNNRFLFNNTTDSFAQEGVLYPEIANRLVERLDLIKIEPKQLLELGAGTGNLTRLLQKHFSKAEYYTVDFAEQRLQKINELKNIYRIAADATRLPFGSNSADMVIANLFPHWIDHQETWLQEAKRVLKVNGLLMFSYFGPDTLREMGKPVQPFYDMHDMGDLLVRMGFNDPILDGEKFTLEYDTAADALADLDATGERALILPLDNLPTGEFNLTYEVVYGHAWKGEQPMTSKIDQSGMVTITLDQITRR